MQKIIIVIPVLNEEELLESFYNSLKKKCLQIIKYEFKFLFVVDKSSDNTEKIINKICDKDKKCSCIIMDDVYGHQECLFAGLEYSKNFDLIITMDGDFQHPIELIEKMIIRYEKGADAVFTIKRMKYKKKSITKFLTNCFYIFFNLISEVKILNNSSDFRLITKKILHKLLKKKWNSVPFLRGELLKLSYNKKVLHFTPIDRNIGHSKFTILRLLRLAFLALLSSSERPIKIIFSLLIVFLLSEIYLLKSSFTQNSEIIFYLLNYFLILFIMLSFIIMLYWFKLKFFKNKSKNKIYQIKKRINI